MLLVSTATYGRGGLGASDGGVPAVGYVVGNV